MLLNLLVGDFGLALLNHNESETAANNTIPKALWTVIYFSGDPRLQRTQNKFTNRSGDARFSLPMAGLEFAWCLPSKAGEAKSSVISPEELKILSILYEALGRIWLEMGESLKSLRWSCRSLEGILFTNCIGRNQQVRFLCLGKSFFFLKTYFLIFICEKNGGKERTRVR